MKSFAVVPKIVTIDTVKEFVDTYRICDTDLVLSTGFIRDTYFSDVVISNFIDVEKYGKGEPNDEMIEAIAKDIKTPYNRVIAIGGGTVLDVSKLFSLKQVTPVTDLFDKIIPAVKDKELILVPTTCGTGSEVTNISILEFKQRKTKFGLAVDELFATEAVVVPELVKNLPFKFFATSSIDALIHAVESYLSPKASNLSQMFSKKAIEMILNGYMEIAKGGEDARKPIIAQFCEASTYAGIAFGNAGCGAVHAMSYPLGAAYHVPHGESNYAMFTGVFYKYMEKNADGRIAELNEYMAEILGCDAKDVYVKLEELLDTSILAKKPLHEYGMTQPQIEEFTDSVIANQQRLLANCYVPLTRDDMLDIYTKLF